MTNLTGKTPADTYGDLLTLTNNGQGLPEADPSGVEDGKGHSSPLALSQTVVSLNAQTTLPQWTTKTRPQNPLPGSVGLNTTTQTIEIFTVGEWTSLLTTPQNASVFAMGLFDYTGKLLKGFNLKNAKTQDTSKYTVAFERPAPDAHYILSLTLECAPTTLENLLWYPIIYQKSKIQFQCNLWTKQDKGLPADQISSFSFSVIVYCVGDDRP